MDGNVAVVTGGTVNTAQTGSYLITYTATDTVGNIATATRTVTVTTSPHYAWRLSAFGAQAGNPAVTGDLIDPNGNGIVNLLEYALGGDPLGSPVVTGMLPIAGRDLNAHLTLSFIRIPSRSDLTLTVQGADHAGGPWTDLAQSLAGQAFSPLTASTSATESGAADQRTVTIGDAYPMSDPAHPLRFLRLQVVH